MFRLAGFIYDVIALVQSALGLVHPPVEKQSNKLSKDVSHLYLFDACALCSYGEYITCTSGHKAITGHDKSHSTKFLNANFLHLVYHDFHSKII